MTKAFVSGCAGPHLSADEINFFRKERPWGLILFARNIEAPEQIRALTDEFRRAVGRKDAPVMVDQEGGRVQRLKPPNWRKYPAPKLYGDLYPDDAEAARRAAWLGARLIASDLRAAGITVNCLPCLDVRFAETSEAIGDRAFSTDADVVIDLGRAMVEGALAGGVLPVIKHIPGHGRASVDSHLELPRVEADYSSLESVDFRPFKALSHVSLGMTAHIVYASIDVNRPGTQSAKVIGDVIRETIGFGGCLMSDDISMKALGGSFQERAQAIVEAGCDIVLHCNGDLDEMRAVADVVPELSGQAATRCEKALSGLKDPDGAFDGPEAWAELQSLTGWQGV